MKRLCEGPLLVVAFVVFFTGLAAAAYVFPNGPARRAACSLDRSGCWVGGPARHLALRLAILGASSVVAMGLWLVARVRAHTGRFRSPLGRSVPAIRLDRRIPTATNDEPGVRWQQPAGRGSVGGTRVEP